MNKIYEIVTTFIIVCLVGCGGGSGGGKSDSEEQNIEKTVEAEVDVTSLTPQREVSHFMTVNPTDSLHKYSYKSDENQTVSLRVTVIEGPNGGRRSSLNVDIQSNLGRTISFESVFNDNSYVKDITVSKDEELLIKISSYGVFKEEYYEYSIEILPETDNGLIQDDEYFEPNNTQATAYPLALSTLITSELLIGSIDQYDTYSIDLKGGINYTVSMINQYGNGHTTTGGLRLEVFDKNKNPLLSVVDFHQYQGGHFVLSPTLDGKYFVRIYSPIGTVFRNTYFKYDLAVWPQHDHISSIVDTKTYEPNDSIPLANSINLGEVIQSELETGPNDFIDNFEIQLAAGGHYELEVTSLDGPKRSSQAALRVEVVSNTGMYILMDESRVLPGQTLNYVLSPVHDTTAVIKLYYNLTVGHEADYHLYRLSVAQQ